MLRVFDDQSIKVQFKWLLWLTDLLGMLSWSLCVRAQHLSDQINVVLTSGPMTDEDVYYHKQESQVWREIRRKVIQGEWVVSSYALVSWCRRRSQREAAKRALNYHQYAKLLSKLNDDRQWQQWVHDSDQPEWLLTHKQLWVSFCVVAGVGLDKALMLWVALRALEEHYHVIMRTPRWRLFWLRHADYIAYMNHAQYNLKMIAQLQTQLGAYMRYGVQHVLYKQQLCHPVSHFTRSLARDGLQGLTMPAAFPEQQLSSGAVHALCQAAFTDDTPRDQRFAHGGMLALCAWEGQQLWMPPALHAKLSGQAWSWRPALVRWQQQWLCDQAAQMHDVASQIASSSDGQDAEDLWQALESRQACLSRLAAWRKRLQSEQQRWLGVWFTKRKRAFLSWWIAWIDQAMAQLRKRERELIFKLCDASYESDHAGILVSLLKAHDRLKYALADSSRVKQAYAKVAPIQLERLRDWYRFVCCMHQLQQWLSLPVLEVQHCDQIESIMRDVTWHDDNPMSAQIRLLVSSKIPDLQRQFADCLMQLVELGDQPQALRQVLRVRALANLLTRLDQGAWICDRLHLLLLIYAWHHRNPRAMGANMQVLVVAMERVLVMGLGGRRFVGVELKGLFKSMTYDRSQKAWPSCQYKAAQLFAELHGQLLRRWLAGAGQRFDRELSMRLRNVGASPAFKQWFWSMGDRPVVGDKGLTQLLSPSLSQADKVMLADEGLPIWPMLQARVTLRAWLASEKTGSDNGFSDVIWPRLHLFVGFLRAHQLGFPSSALQHLLCMAQLMSQISALDEPSRWLQQYGLWHPQADQNHPVVDEQHNEASCGEFSATAALHRTDSMVI